MNRGVRHRSTGHVALAVVRVFTLVSLALFIGSVVALHLSPVLK